MIDEIFIVEYLSEHLSVPVFAEDPDDDGIETFAFITKTGSEINDYIRSATFAFQVIGRNKITVLEINEEVKSAVFDMIREDRVSGIHFNTEYENNDTTKKRYGYRSVFDIVFFNMED